MRPSVLFLAAAAAAMVSFAVPANAAEKLPPISTTQVHRVDPVSAKEGKKEEGSIEFAVRDGDVVRYMASMEHCAEYVKDPGKYPDADAATRVAFMGADPVARFPSGVKSPAIGNVVNGDPALSAEFRGATYWFASADNKTEFLRQPAQYVPPVGGYCLGAMAAGRAVPGDPRHVFYLPEVGTWAVFGSPNGPAAFAKMTSKQREDAYWTAVWYYKHLTRHPDAVALK